jgi:hypothetical protein
MGLVSNVTGESVGLDQVSTLARGLPSVRLGRHVGLADRERIDG